MSDYENSDVQKSDEKLAPPPGSDYEVAFTYHSDNQLERAYDKAEHWVRCGVKPNQVFLDDRSMGVINFRKEMRDPLLIQAGVERLIDFRCSLTLSDTDVDAVFSSVSYYEPGCEPTYINAYDPELSSIREVLNMVSNNLFNYLQKPLVQTDAD
ncbi:MAG: hypothetical protein U0O25_05465 [Succinivibrio sp.]|uniref:Uncharacterized protein n=1 Tax=Succinivibrio faecicola TaxID=2820300 RepID=A0ABS7DGN4_9GAMM|nr:hypothetical protein [Succinivibrio faecicola]MBW7569686.1 hypothetical protein [Succinivibrio faecicola]MCI6938256.1 hypothetical protein [Succinatimonas hippei]